MDVVGRRWGWLPAALVLGAATLATLQLSRGLAYWDYSEGVYALTARLFLNGHGLYGEVVAAQPPGLFLFGAGALWLHDSLGTLRLVVGLAQLAAGLVAAGAVWRLTGRRALAAFTPVVFLLTPWSVHEHGALIPETLAPLVLLTATLLLAREQRVPVGALLAGLAVFLKLSFALPALAIVAVTPWRRRALPWAAGTVVVVGAIATIVFGSDLWRDVVVAQARVGHETLRHIGQKWVQEAWSLAGLVAAAAIAARSARSAAPPASALPRLLIALAAGFLLTGLTTIKHGTSLNILPAIEAALVPLAMAALALPGRVRWIAAAGIAFTLAQTASLLFTSPTAPPFLYPSSQRGAWGEALSDAAVSAKARQIQAACPPGRPYGGPPLLAMAAHRTEPLDQPDGFLTTYSPTFAGLHARIAKTSPVCPP